MGTGGFEVTITGGFIGGSMTGGFDCRTSCGDEHAATLVAARVSTKGGRCDFFTGRER